MIWIKFFSGFCLLGNNLVPRVFRKDPGIGWSRASSKIDRPRGCGESIKLQTVKNINFANYYLCQRRLDSRPQSIMGIERLIPRVASLTVDCRGVNISLTKQIWKLSNDNSVRYSVKQHIAVLLRSSL